MNQCLHPIADALTNFHKELRTLVEVRLCRLLNELVAKCMRKFLRIESDTLKTDIIDVVIQLRLL